ncbi:MULTISPECIES: phosphotransferase [unclassified Rhodococcus (in: high G+C Gram-positive bacteria)]|uniref:phosphotransferase family protein n=1 Tax=unclassified Rhodococcus (in: high G+C Gram-positive bacteria) TaxID=192944 RepID=UPI003399F39C
MLFSCRGDRSNAFRQRLGPRLLPTDFAWTLRTLARAQARIEADGFDAVPCHCDGNVSNVLVLDDGSMRLVDWDSAALMDPLQGIGAWLAQIRPFDVREVFEMSGGGRQCFLRSGSELRPIDTSPEPSGSPRQAAAGHSRRVRDPKRQDHQASAAIRLLTTLASPVIASVNCASVWPPGTPGITGIVTRGPHSRRRTSR